MSRFLATLLESAARSSHGMVTGEPREPVRHSWAEVHDRARAMVAALRADDDGHPGLPRGAAVGVLAGEPVAIAPLAQAVWLCGGSVTMLHQPTTRTDLAAWAEDTVSVLKMIDAALVVLGPPFDALAPILTEHGIPFRSIDSLDGDGATVRADEAAAGEGDTALLQLTSGSTAEPKAVRITLPGTGGSLQAGYNAVPGCDTPGQPSTSREVILSEQVVWLVIALAMYRHWSISEVLDSLDLALPNEAAPFVSKSAVAQARQRIGEAPMAWLFEQTARAWTSQDAAHHAFKGLSLWAMDGTTLRTPDSPANREHFGAQGYASGKVASYPQVRAVTLTAIPTHLVADINFGRYDTNEMVYAKSLLPQIPEDSLTVFDKGFLAAEILCGLTMNARNRHFLIPAKANTCWEVISGTADDAMVRMRVSQQARKKCPTLPEFWNARAIRTIDARGRERVLLTSLGDRRRFKPADIVACYERRWQIETSYGELKQSMLVRS